MASSISLGYPLWTDGMTWTSLLQRQLDGGVAVWDSNASTAAVAPLGGVFPGPGSPLAVTQQASPNMSVLVNAGYCAIPHPTSGDGVYLMGVLAQATLTIASNGAGSTRDDLIVARIHDLGNSSSNCTVEVVQGTAGSGQPATPSACLLLAVVAVASGASSITNGSITDSRTYTVAPGGVLPVASVNAAPSVASGEVVYNTGAGALERATTPLVNTAVFSVPGSGTWTSPFTGNLTVTPVGPGGGGSQSSANQTDGSGGAGEWAQQVVPVVQGHVYNWAVGAGGEGGSDSSGPTSGSGPTSFSGTGITTVQANPGQAGKASSGGGTGAGGTGSTNTAHSNGGSGTANSSDPPVLGGPGGGAAGGPSGAGLPGSAPSGNRGGAGGVAGPGSGSGGRGGDVGEPGSDGQFPGGGGGAAGDGQGQILNGGDGADGYLLLSWTITPSALTALGSAGTESDVVDTSTGASGSQGLTPGNGSAYGWGIGYGSTTYIPGGFGFFGGFGGSGFDADGTIVQQIQVPFTADGQTDFAIDAKWGLAVPEAAVDGSSPSISKGQCQILIMLDGTILDTVYLCCSASGGVTRPGDAGSVTYYTSAGRGDTPAAGSHVAALAIRTQNTLSGQLSGAHVGNLASVGTSPHPFGGALATYFTAALAAENCSLRVSGVLASAI